MLDGWLLVVNRFFESTINLASLQRPLSLTPLTCSLTILNSWLTVLQIWSYSLPPTSSAHLLRSTWEKIKSKVYPLSIALSVSPSLTLFSSSSPDEDLIKYGTKQEIWFHVDKVCFSSIFCCASGS